MSARLIHVIEDESDIAELMRYNLQLGGYQVSAFSSGDVGLKSVLNDRPDLLLLDIMLPGMNGLDVCKFIKQNPQTNTIPVIMVSAKGEETDIVKGLELGADDYITKPFSPKVLLARVEAVLRRTRSAPVEQTEILRVGGIEVHVGKVEALVHGVKVDLTQSEFRILHFLAQRPGWVFTRGQIVEAIRGENYAVTDRTIDFQMVGLRRKLGDAGAMIETVRGVGYRFKDTE